MKKSMVILKWLWFKASGAVIMNKMNMEQRWLSLFDSSISESMKAEFQHLAEMYGEKHRHYHTLDHIASCIELLDGVNRLVNDSYSLELALWFHDAVYNPGKLDNEKKSALYAMKVLKQADIEDEKRIRIAELVEMTRHSSEPVTDDCKFITDIDLAILGAEPDLYMGYTEKIRREYSCIPSLIYRRGRKKLLGLFLERERIFHTEFFFERYERNARVNIKREIEAL